MIPPMGCIKSLIDHLSDSKHPLVSSSSINILHELSYNKPCVDSMIRYDHTLLQIMKAISCDNSLAPVGCRTLTNMFEADSDDKLVPIALKVKLVDFLLKLLDSGHSSFDNSTKALIVNLLKSMQHSQNYGQQIGNILGKNPIWSEFRDQKHDLFISTNSMPSYLTG